MLRNHHFPVLSLDRAIGLYRTDVLGDTLQVPDPVRRFPYLLQEHDPVKVALQVLGKNIIKPLDPSVVAAVQGTDVLHMVVSALHMLALGHKGMMLKLIISCPFDYRADARVLGNKFNVSTYPENKYHFGRRLCKPLRFKGGVR